MNRWEGKGKSNAKLGEILKTITTNEAKGNPVTTTRTKLQGFGRQFDKDVIETMHKLGYSLKDVYEGLMTGETAILEPYNRMVEEKKRAEEFKKALNH